jgi:prolyl-tRNA editing enzyme YbaK/EbsC (Cys-tRNA(Pro) deacylase)
VRERTGFAIGGVAPIAHATPPHVFLDQDLFAFARIYAAAGSPFAVFALAPDELERMTGGRRADIRRT